MIMCKKICFFWICWLLFSGYARSNDDVTLLFVGDAMMHQSQIDQARDGSGFDFSRYFSAIREEIGRADLAVVNLEVPLAGAPYSGYPVFSSPDAFAVALKDAGFNVFLLANNHCLDKTTRGLKRTLAVMDTLGIRYAGAYTGPQARALNYPLLLSRNGFRIAMLNYTYGTNGFTVQPPYIVNYIDKKQMAADIEEAKRMKPDIIVANIHWGEEYKLLPSSGQKELAGWLFDQGVEIIIGNHPHVVQPMEMRRDVTGRPTGLVVYSLGNFVSNMSIPYTAGGGLVRVRIVRDPDSGRAQIASAAYSLLYTHRGKRAGGKVSYEVVPASAWYDSADKDTVPDIDKLRKYVKDVRTLLDKHNSGVKEYIFE